MRQENSRCLVLNADYSPLCVIDWKRAIAWSWGRANTAIEILDYYKNDYILGPNNKKYQIPCVIKTYRYFEVYNRKVNFSRKNLFIRDNYTCQYCGIKKEENQLTYDHIVPKCRLRNKRKTDWYNIVAACKKCNRLKSNRTPKEANMRIINDPIEPSFSIKYLPVLKDLLIINEAWVPYLNHKKIDK